MIKNIKTILIVASFIIIGTVVFSACQKEEAITKISPTETVSLKNQITPIQVTPIDEQTIIKAHNIMVDFLLRSKSALDKHTDKFEEVCKNGKMEELIELIYPKEEAIEKGEEFMELVKEISAAYPTATLPEEPYCSSCALESFPETLRGLNYTSAVAGGPDWGSLALCLADCALSCGSCCCYVPYICAGCVTVCTAACYYLSTSAYVAHYSHEYQHYY